MDKKVAVIIPFYKDSLTAYELIALQQCQKVLSAYSIVAVKPEHLTLPFAATDTITFNQTESFDNDYFKSIAGYNRLMLSAEFYERFLDYEYILIYQLDAFVFRDELSDWCNSGFDYIGAPWLRKTHHKNFIGLAFFNAKKKFRQLFNIASKHKFTGLVGNGGFSLRRVRKFYEIAASNHPLIDYYLEKNDIFHNEDLFWGVEVNREKRVLNVADYDSALKFAFEVPPKKAKHYNKANLPFGCHAWDRYPEFWRPIFKLYDYNI